MKQLYLPLLLAILLFAPEFLSAQRVGRRGVNPVNTTASKKGPVYNFTLAQLQGRWQETKRTDADKSALPIGDTIYLHFTEADKVETRDGTKTIMRGVAFIDEPGNILVAAADVYTIGAISETELLLLDDDGTVHTLTKKDIFWRETLGKNAVTDPVLDTPLDPNLADLAGINWTVYRRRAKPGAVSNESVLIRYIKSIKDNGDKTATAELTFYSKDKTEVMPCTITVVNNQIEVKSGGHSWLMYVYKVEKDEWIFGDHKTLLYFAKPL
ncbi:hypothetical protein [Lacibacter sediminis]|uniref:Uncharacterized protein n=1 Tax=Lacibacter sediminis TaxID=2760713 RepID=A0A7G5XCN5_9BACT|nr:hypothetical protein [Lacibacter sediminis]QNA43238.1 hypothetical protein H4075_14260 [Lacibacter sediminis]